MNNNQNAFLQLTDPSNTFAKSAHISKNFSKNPPTFNNTSFDKNISNANSGSGSGDLNPEIMDMELQPVYSIPKFDYTPGTIAKPPVPSGMSTSLQETMKNLASAHKFKIPNGNMKKRPREYVLKRRERKLSFFGYFK